MYECDQVIADVHVMEESFHIMGEIVLMLRRRSDHVMEYMLMCLNGWC